MALICTLQGPLDERSASYVTAMAILGLSHLHRLGIAYRGLSAITLLVTEGGLVQLVDFRFAKAAEGRTFTLCGVPEYLAPEVVGGTGHDESVDWWALGVLVFHLITGERERRFLADLLSLFSSVRCFTDCHFLHSDALGVLVCHLSAGEKVSVLWFVLYLHSVLVNF